MGRVGQPLVVRKLVRRGQRHAVFVGVAVDVVGVHAKKALVLAHLHARAHDFLHVGRPDVQPLLARPAVQVAALVAGLKVAGVRPPVFERAGREVADRVAALGLDGGHDLLAVVKAVDEIDLRLRRAVCVQGGRSDRGCSETEGIWAVGSAVKASKSVHGRRSCRRVQVTRQRAPRGAAAGRRWRPPSRYNHLDVVGYVRGADGLAKYVVELGRPARREVGDPCSSSRPRHRDHHHHCKQ